MTSGGTHEINNLRISCHRCNQVKGARLTPEQVRELLHVVAR